MICCNNCTLVWMQPMYLSSCDVHPSIYPSIHRYVIYRVITYLSMTLLFMPIYQCHYRSRSWYRHGDPHPRDLQDSSSAMRARWEIGADSARDTTVLRLLLWCTLLSSSRLSLSQSLSSSFLSSSSLAS